MLAVSKLVAGYGEAQVLREIDIAVGQGEMVALVGANGAGKSTLLKTIAGLLRATSGNIALAGKSITRASAAERVRSGIALVPEGRQIFGGLSVEENLFLGAYAHGRAATAAELRSRIDEVCAIFPILRDRLNAAAAGLSGGQQQMLAIARGLMAKPALLLLDEPSLGLAPTLVTEIFRIIVGLRSRGTSILIAEQNARLTLAVADRGYVLENGRIAAAGTGRELLGSTEIVDRYLGIGVRDRAAPTGPGAASIGQRLRAILYEAPL